MPIGAYKGADLSPNAPFLSYITDLVDNWPSPIKNTSQLPNAVDVYRRALAAQSDHSVAISSIGLLTNLAALLMSSPDQHSLLSGPELVARKVKILVVMGGEYPSSGAHPAGCNFCGCVFGDEASATAASAASSYVFSNMPPEVKVVLSGASLGRQVQTGGVLSACAPTHNPCRQAYIDYEGAPGKSRYSWDLLTTLVAVRGARGASCLECTDCDGVNWVNGTTGANSWVYGMPSNQSFLVLKDAMAAAATIDSLLCQPPRPTPMLHADRFLYS